MAEGGMVGSFAVRAGDILMPNGREVIVLPGVYLDDGEYNFDIALRRFKKQVE